MKRLLVILLAAFFANVQASSQVNQFMTWSHEDGHTPSQYMIVEIGEEFEFHNIGVQTHPHC